VGWLSSERARRGGPRQVVECFTVSTDPLAGSTGGDPAAQAVRMRAFDQIPAGDWENPVVLKVEVRGHFPVSGSGDHQPSRPGRGRPQRRFVEALHGRWPGITARAGLCWIKRLRPEGHGHRACWLAGSRQAGMRHQPAWPAWGLVSFLVATAIGGRLGLAPAVSTARRTGDGPIRTGSGCCPPPRCGAACWIPTARFAGHNLLSYNLYLLPGGVVTEERWAIAARRLARRCWMMFRRRAEQKRRNAGSGDGIFEISGLAGPLAASRCCVSRSRETAFAASTIDVDYLRFYPNGTLGVPICFRLHQAANEEDTAALAREGYGFRDRIGRSGLGAGVRSPTWLC